MWILVIFSFKLSRAFHKHMRRVNIPKIYWRHENELLCLLCVFYYCCYSLCLLFSFSLRTALALLSHCSQISIRGVKILSVYETNTIIRVLWSVRENGSCKNAKIFHNLYTKALAYTNTTTNCKLWWYLCYHFCVPADIGSIA